LGAAYALGLNQQLGSLDLGKSCDFVCLAGSWRNLFYSVGNHPVTEVYKSGVRLQAK
jgi:imidazolonepropionase